MNKQLKEITDTLKQKTEKTCCSITVLNDAPSILDNKMGGRPYLPVGESYPYHNDEPMVLLLQVNCKDLHLPEYPDNGILEIFIDASLDSFPYYSVVRYYQEGLNYQTDFPEINYKMSVFWEKGRSGDIGYKINLKNVKVFMNMTDYRFDKLVRETVYDVTGITLDKHNYCLSDLEKYFPEEKDIFEFIFNELENDKYPITIGGYAAFTQEDPRPVDFKNQDECLFKFDSCYDLSKFYIGDAGIMCFFISKEEIAAHDFYMAKVSWDCC